VEEEQRLSSTSTHTSRATTRVSAYQQEALRNVPLLVPRSDQDVLMAVALFDVWPLRYTAIIEVRRSVCLREYKKILDIDIRYLLFLRLRQLYRSTVFTS